MHCRRFIPASLTRRQMLLRCANGFGAVALSAMLSDQKDSHAASQATHHPARAKNIIFLYMDGGPSQVDTFDPKPRLIAEHGERPRFRVEPTQFNQNGTVMQSPWRFRQYGQSGISVSDLF